MSRALPPLEGKTLSTEKQLGWVGGVAGFTAGFVTTLACHPLDVIKVRLQMDLSSRAATRHVGSASRIVRDIWRHEKNIWGVTQGFYRGLTPNIIGNTWSWGVYFWSYEHIKSYLHELQGQDKELGVTQYWAASFTSGIFVSLASNPIWVIKTRMTCTDRYTPGAYPNITAGVKDIWRNEGFKGFYRGLLPSFIGCTHGGFQFAFYEQSRKWLAGWYGGQAAMKAVMAPNRNPMYADGTPVQLGELDTVLCSASAKIFAGTVTYPYQVVRSRLQFYNAESGYKGAMDAMRQIRANEGLKGFYKGIVPNTLRVVPSACVTFVVYEGLKKNLPVWAEEYKNNKAAGDHNNTD